VTFYRFIIILEKNLDCYYDTAKLVLFELESLFFQLQMQPPQSNLFS